MNRVPARPCVPPLQRPSFWPSMLSPERRIAWAQRSLRSRGTTRWLGARRLRRLNLELEKLRPTKNAQHGGHAGALRCEQPVQVVDAGDGVARKPDDHVPFRDSREFGGARVLHRENEDPGLLGQAVMPRDCAVNGRALSSDSEMAATNAALLNQLACNTFHEVDLDGEAKSLCRCDDGSVDSNDLAARVHKRPARIPGIESRVGLNHVVDQSARGRPHRAAACAHDSGRHRALEAKVAADGDRELTRTYPAGIAEPRRAKFRGVDFENGEVRIGVVPHERRFATSAVGCAHLDPSGTMDDVAVGDEETVGREHKAGPTPAYGLPPRPRAAPLGRSRADRGAPRGA